MILLQTENLARHFGAEVLYEKVSFQIKDHDRIALVGRNGAGKSTLISQLIGEEPISAGTISKARDISIGYLEQHVAIDSELTIWEEMMETFSDTLKKRDQAVEAAELVAKLSNQTESPEYTEALASYDRLQEELNRLNAYGIESEIRTVLHGFQFYEEDYETPVQALSGGQKTRLALAKILLQKHDLLILDEPTNHLDMETMSWLEGYLANYRGALLLVSHDRYFLNRMVNQVIELRNHTLHTYKGDYDFYLKERALRMRQEQEAYQRQQEKISELEDFVQRNIARASTSGMAKSRRKQLERMDRIERPMRDEDAPRIQFRTERSSGEQVIQAKNLAVGYPGMSEPLAKNINFDLRRQNAIAVVGANGVGKTTLLRTLVKELKPMAGEIEYGTGLKVGYYDQNVNRLDPDLTVLETVWHQHDTTDEWKIRSYLGSFLFSGETVQKKVSLLSGGEKARLSLLLLALENNNTLLLDEPTNHLDIDSKEVLEEALIEFDGTLFFVSHDRYFINRIATHVLEITPNESKLYLGDYDYYLSKKAEEKQIEDMKEIVTESVRKEKSAGKLSWEESRTIQRQIRQLKKRVQESEEKNENLDQQINQIHDQMVAAAEENKQEELVKLSVELQQLEEDQLIALEEWEEAASEYENFAKDYPQFK